VPLAYFVYLIKATRHKREPAQPVTVFIETEKKLVTSIILPYSYIVTTKHMGFKMKIQNIHGLAAVEILSYMIERAKETGYEITDLYDSVSVTVENGVVFYYDIESNEITANHAILLIDSKLFN
jgi:hypothetical protein